LLGGDIECPSGLEVDLLLFFSFDLMYPLYLFTVTLKKTLRAAPATKKEPESNWREERGKVGLS